MERIFHYTITKTQEGNTVYDFLHSLGYSRSLLLHLKRTPQGILRNGQNTFGSTLLQEGDHLDIRLVESISSQNIHPLPWN